jgi:microcystin-dependent protein
MATYRPLIVNAVANQIQELASGDSLTGITTVTATTFVGNGITPIGGIIMWSGTVAGISTLTGWALCDGANGTPDLRNRFIVGAHSGAGTGITSTTGPGISTDTATNPNYTPGNTGGETSHQLTVAELASHTHTLDTRDSTADNGVGSPPNQEFAGWDGGPDRGAVDTQSKGGNNYHENRPPYYALAFIMRTL